MRTVIALSALLASASAAAVSSPKVSYDGYKVVRVSAGADTDRVNKLVEKLGLATWKEARHAGSFADIVVPPSKLSAFHQETSEMETVTMHEDLGESIAQESTFHTYVAGSAVNATWFESYHPYEDHMSWLKDIQAQFSDQSEIVTSGDSYEGNTITGLHFYGSSGGGTNPAVVFHGAVHAREWITSMTIEYIAYTLLNDPQYSDFLDKYDFYIYPFVNPDGFIYTQTNDRMWRKNRQPTSGSSCLGHDINRNWDYQWDLKGGASTSPCAEDFKGSSAGDAPETKALAAGLQAIKDAQGLKLYIDYHSYSQLWMYPYGYSCSATPDNDSQLSSISSDVVAAIAAVHGTEFEAGPICNTIYMATGSSVDYVADVVGADYTFTTELRDTGNYGFLLPPEQIVPSGEESFAAVQVLLKNMQ